ncbi:hypothetical protein ONE63_007688 [Megalurothrips usitatus]|uniref:Angiotensin-converting enzyme n=1 Tax=Megalurothrips usitatus TaxID=439358 RepID=A0AAV7XTC5_9NEOP|nr:hypothetical protein ONE63_007688 [Megalurothrips usitatus]
MCRAAGQYDPENDDLQLHKCDIYRSKEAGKVLKKLMEQGSSVPWTEALHAATGESRLNGSALREFFRPLEEWLQNENLRTAEFVGWTYGGCRSPSRSPHRSLFLMFYFFENSFCFFCLTFLRV